MDIQVKQRGRASIDFLLSIGRATGKLEPTLAAEMSEAGITEETLADDLDERLVQVERAMADSLAYRAKAVLGEWYAVNHGLIAREAFEEIEADIAPEMEALASGPTTIKTVPHFAYPDYMRDVWIHRTHGGWDGHPHQGLIHAEFIHKRVINQSFGGDIFGQRRAVLEHLPRRDYRNIFEIGVSSGFHTVALAEAFPDARISGCDFSRPMLEQARRMGNERQMAWTLYVACGEDTGLPTASFDLVSSFIVLHELPADAIRAVFAEAYRLLEPGGTMMMTDVPPYSEHSKMTVWRFDRAGVLGGEPYWRESSLVDTVALAREVGFETVKAVKLPTGNYWMTIAEKAR